MAPGKCMGCEEGRACINGRFCLKLKRYVEYEHQIICSNEQK